MEKDLSTIFKDLNEAERSFMAALDGARKAVADAVNFIKEEKREEFEAQQKDKDLVIKHMKLFDEFSERTRDAVEGRR